MKIFASSETRKQRALQMLLTLVIVGIGLVCTMELNSVSWSVAGGVLTGISMTYLGDTFWPSHGDAPDRRQWVLFFALLVIPCGIASSGVLIFALNQHNLTDTYFGAVLLAAVIWAPIQLYRASKRVSE